MKTLHELHVAERASNEDDVVAIVASRERMAAIVAEAARALAALPAEDVEVSVTLSGRLARFKRKPCTLDDLANRHREYLAKMVACAHEWARPHLDADLGRKCTRCGVHEIPWLERQVDALRDAAAERDAAVARAETAEADLREEKAAVVRMFSALFDGDEKEGAKFGDVFKAIVADRDALRARLELAEAVCEAAEHERDCRMRRVAREIDVATAAAATRMLDAALAVYDRAKEANRAKEAKPVFPKHGSCGSR